MIVPIKIGKELQEINPGISLGTVECGVTNSDHNDELWHRIAVETKRIRQSLSFDRIKDLPQIAATRKMYSSCGKDPSRYRPSAEALMRRIVKGQELYRINTLVDIVNLVSLQSGFSIGAFDVSYIEGAVEAGLGKADEIFHAIGRGLLNIENLPVLRDIQGPIGNPTSDEERTAIRESTNHLLMVIYSFVSASELPAAMDSAVHLLKQHARAEVKRFDVV